MNGVLGAVFLLEDLESLSRTRGPGLLARVGLGGGGSLGEEELTSQSALSVLGKASPSSNVERVDLKIHDPDNSLRSKRKRNRAIHDGDTTGDEGSEDELSRGIEAYLVMKLVCKHGKLSCPFPSDEADDEVSPSAIRYIWALPNSYEQTLIPIRHPLDF